MLKRHFFTLLELLSVIGIIAIVAGIILGGMNYASRRADEAKTISLMTQLEMALDAFKQDRGYYPPAAAGVAVEFFVNDSDDVLTLLLDGEKHPFINSKTKEVSKRPYIELGWVKKIKKENAETEADPYKDSWGNAFQYRCPGTNNTSSYDLWSVGPDGVLDTDDDICNWKKN